MSIRPVSDVELSTVPADAVAVRAPAATSAASSQPPDPGTVPIPPSHRGDDTSELAEAAQDVVQVQRDPVTKAIVIRYLDRSGSVILEVPSEQVLNLARVISEELGRGKKEPQELDSL